MKDLDFTASETLMLLDARGKEKWHGYTVFTFNFNGVPIHFVTLKDADYVLQLAKGARQK